MSVRPAKLLLMTGVEAAAAGIVGKVVERAGEQLSEERKNVKQELLSQGADTAYMKDAGKNYAKNIAIRQAIVTKMYEKMAKWFGLANEYYGGDFNTDMAEKLKDVPEENLIAPKPSLAAPAMQHLGYSLDEPDLKEMYLNLLATASDDRRSDDVHPSFVEVIKQLNSTEVGLLNHLLKPPSGGVLPMVTLKLVEEGHSGWSVLQRHIMPLLEDNGEELHEDPHLATYVENWMRLGLVRVIYTEYATGEEAYGWVEDRPEYVRHVASLTDGQSVEVQKGILQKTPFGEAFARAVGITA